MEPIHWHISTFTELTVPQWYSLAALRQQVFIVEQQCIFLDLDGKDEKALHLWASEDKTGLHPMAYARIFYPGVLYEPASIGRILTAPDARGQGLGKRIVEKAIRLLRNHTPECAIRIAAQAYLIRFYEGFGFKTVSQEYLDDDIWHVDMMLWP
jgi:ElaA protein